MIDRDEVIADGLTVLATPGHTAAHQSVVADSGDERVIIGAQAVWQRAEFEDGVASAANVDLVKEVRMATVESIRRLNALNAQVVHFSNCAPHQRTG